jgi:RNA polymerase sigma factor (sigma-70 family)
VNPQDQLQKSGQALLPQLDAAYNLARWLVRDAALAEDAVREAYLRAARSFAPHARSDNASGRTWLLGFVRESCHARLDRDSAEPIGSATDDADTGHPPRRRMGGGVSMDCALAALPVPWRECIVLHDIEGLSYADLAQVIDAPLGTVMSRLGDARRALRQNCTTTLPPITLQPAVVDH